MVQETNPQPKRKVEIRESSFVPDYYYEDTKEYKDSYMFICKVEGIARPIMVFLPVEEATPEKVREKVLEEVKKREEKKPPEIPPFEI